MALSLAHIVIRPQAPIKLDGIFHIVDKIVVRGDRDRTAGGGHRHARPDLQLVLRRDRRLVHGAIPLGDAHGVKIANRLILDVHFTGHRAHAGALVAIAQNHVQDLIAGPVDVRPLGHSITKRRKRPAVLPLIRDALRRRGSQIPAPGLAIVVGFPLRRVLVEHQTAQIRHAHTHGRVDRRIPDQGPEGRPETDHRRDGHHGARLWPDALPSIAGHLLAIDQAEHRLALAILFGHAGQVATGIGDTMLFIRLSLHGMIKAPYQKRFSF